MNKNPIGGGADRGERVQADRAASLRAPAPAAREHLPVPRPLPWAKNYTRCIDLQDVSAPKTGETSALFQFTRPHETSPGNRDLAWPGGVQSAAAAVPRTRPPASREPIAAAGELLPFAQRAFAAQGRDALLDDTGHLYVVPSCAAGETCGLLIAFHGCEQNVTAVGEALARDAGFNRWADAQGVVVRYPRTRSSYLPLNPKACWDGWGYTGADYDTRDGAQMAWAANAVAAWGLPLR